MVSFSSYDIIKRNIRFKGEVSIILSKLSDPVC